MALEASELILNPNGSIYHLGLVPDQLADLIITVGDPKRVESVSKHFDAVEFSLAKREFHTVTGRIGNQRLTVISTGIGTDNIDIVLNELDALINIDLKTRTVKTSAQALNIVRIGTSGSLQADIEVDSFVLSTHGLGLDGLLLYYAQDAVASLSDVGLRTKIENYLASFPVKPYLAEGSKTLLNRFLKAEHNNGAINWQAGITATCTGFYAPQGRKLRLDTRIPDLLERLGSFSDDSISENKLRITNFEMETAGLYGLSGLLGHQCLSVNAILANRVSGKFSSDPGKAVDRAIKASLDILIS
jgi:uridine phosphorylase